MSELMWRSSAIFLALLLIVSSCKLMENQGPPGNVGTAGPAATPSATAAASSPPTSAPTLAATASPAAPGPVTLQEFPVVAGSGPHDVAPAADGGVWYTGQRNGTLGHLDPRTGAVREVRLGPGSSPHGVIVDRNGVAWVTDSGQNAIVSVDPRNGEIGRAHV